MIKYINCSFPLPKDNHEICTYPSPHRPPFLPHRERGRGESYRCRTQLGRRGVHAVAELRLQQARLRDRVRSGSGTHRPAGQTASRQTRSQREDVRTGLGLPRFAVRTRPHMSPLKEFADFGLSPFSGLLQFLETKHHPKRVVFCSHKLSTNGEFALA